MENTPTDMPMICVQIWKFPKMTPNREVSTFFSAAGFCPKQCKRLYLPANAPPGWEAPVEARIVLRGLAMRLIRGRHTALYEDNPPDEDFVRKFIRLASQYH